MEAGTRLGPYVISGPLGSGGMGEVYEAVDERLGRRVAIKVLPAHLRDDPERLQRFEREAKVLAGLSHPHICTLHDVGAVADLRFLVMERLEGEPVAEVLQHGRLTPTRAIEIGMQLCAALDEAHRNGIVHRDVKPENVVLTRSGAKLLDFGLAHPIELRPGSDSDQTTRIQELTRQGALVGTLRYMSPEQLHGQAADARSDIFALGLLLYRMLSGRHAFEGASDAAIIAAILEQDVAAFPDSLAIHPLVARAIRRCLEKDPENRWQSARDLLLELQSIEADEELLQTTPANASTAGRFGVWLLAAALALLALLGWMRSRPVAEATFAVHLALSLPEHNGVPTPLISPDGRMLVMRADLGEGRRLWARRIDDTELREIPRTEGVISLFWSPDSRHVGFFADGELRVVNVDGGPVTTLCSFVGQFPAGSWGIDGTILFSVTETGGQDGLYRVAESGGMASRVTLKLPDGTALMALGPSFLPDGRFFAIGYPDRDGLRPDDVSLVIASLDSDVAQVLQTPFQSTAKYSRSGHLLYGLDQTLFAEPFDLERLEFTGDRVAIAENLSVFGPQGDYRFSLSDDDILVYQVEGGLSQLEWRDRSGRSLGTIGEPAYHVDLTLSPDDRELAVVRRESGAMSGDVWIVDLERQVDRRFTVDPGDAIYTLWTPDRTGLVFANAVEAPPFMHRKDFGAKETTVLLPSNGNLQVPESFTSDGSELIFVNRDPDTGTDLWKLPMREGATPEPYLDTQAGEFGAEISPDDEWIAYLSNESGQYEVYVMSYRTRQGTKRISTDGASLVRWRGDGSELFYFGSDGVIYSVEVEVVAGELLPAKPVALFSLEAERLDGDIFDVTKDGSRFVVARSVSRGDEGTQVLLNWTAKLAGRR